MTRHTALTWDHPRGYDALARAAARFNAAHPGESLVWETQPLEGFESHPIADLCSRYDLVVLDHPHIGEAIEAACLQPLDAVFPPWFLDQVARRTVGPCLASYRMAGRTWALPLDAATQVMAVQPEALTGSVPTTWADLIAYADRHGGVALCLAGPHALLTFLSIVASLGHRRFGEAGRRFIPAEEGRRAYEILRRLFTAPSRAVMEMNPIHMLEHMTEGRDIAICPLIYQYVTYCEPDQARPLDFHDAPRVAPSHRPGSILGGTGIAVTKRCRMSPALADHLQWLMSEDAQTGLVAETNGQPSAVSAWRSAAVNEGVRNFYRNTLQTMDAASIRPRFNGYIAVQAALSAHIRDCLATGRSTDDFMASIADYLVAEDEDGLVRGHAA